MSERLCILCGERPREVPDRERQGRPVKRICRACHAAQLRGDLAILLRSTLADMQDRLDRLTDCGMPAEDQCTRGVYSACRKHLLYRALRAEAALSKVEAETIERCAQAVRKVSGMPSAYEDAIRKLITPEER